MPITTLDRPEATEYASFYAPYVALVPETDLLPALEAQGQVFIPFLEALPEALAGHRYAPGKWSVRQLVGHLSDAERVFAYRLFRFSRADETPLAGFNEDPYVANGGYESRSLADLVAEFRHLRAANLLMIRGLEPAMTTLQGPANGHAVSVRALACIMVGHARHHEGVLRERYL